ncbi:shikimate dehydrogenase [Lacticaseibacillus paracasei]|uniref:shikimate dehydrogenase n=1 Tax=Lacticaseibacillus paracasei TaxID=1597 RepID=UPI00272B4F91|nr:shikimate dehydrogenase [Lacticaseibacillus paracasei]WKZ96609.1 shikimate dehydrogenase [Lacticaseibacillus paracasei]
MSLKDEIDGHTVLAGLLAHPAGHSMSPAMYNATFEKLGLNDAYLSFDVDAPELAHALQAMRGLHFLGGNLSMPNKQKAIPLLDKLSPAAKLIGAVNTIVNDHGVLTGHITDGTGFMQALSNDGLDIRGEKMTLAGAGGAGTAIAIQAALDGVREINIFNRRDASWQNAERNVAIINDQTQGHATLFALDDQPALKASISDSVIYVDATPAGMKPLETISNVPDGDWFTPETIVFDTVYAPRETKLMQLAKEAGVNHVYNGINMLINQGAAAFHLWTGLQMPVDYIRETVFGEPAAVAHS